MPMRQKAPRRRLARQQDVGAKTGANSRGPKHHCAQFPLGHIAMNKGAEMSQSRPPAQLRARRFAQTAQSALFIACLIACFIAVFPLALPLAGENARTGLYPSGPLSTLPARAFSNPGAGRRHFGLKIRAFAAFSLIRFSFFPAHGTDYPLPRLRHLVQGCARSAPHLRRLGALRPLQARV